MAAIDKLISVLCDPEGRCCIHGSDEDRRIVDEALNTLRQGDAAMPVAAWLTMGSKDGKHKFEIGEASPNPRYIEIHRDFAWEPLVRQSDAQAALAAKDAEIESLTTERDALRKDAARYRWLRVSTDCDVYVYSGSEFRNESLQRESLDAYTDAAIAKEKAK